MRFWRVDSVWEDRYDDLVEVVNAIANIERNFDLPETHSLWWGLTTRQERVLGLALHGPDWVHPADIEGLICVHCGFIESLKVVTGTCKACGMPPYVVSYHELGEGSDTAEVEFFGDADD